MGAVSIDSLKKKLNECLPGMDAHLKMTPYRRLTKVIPDDRREGAVLLLLYEKEGELFFPLIQRAEYKGVHSNQISFPGGKVEADDDTLLQTAIRETEEEIGVSRTLIKNLGAISELYIPPSNFMVSPFVGYISNEPSFVKEEREVKEILEISLSEFLENSPIKETEVIVGDGMKLKTPYFELNGKVVWGATAAILQEFKELCEGIFDSK